MVQIHKVTRPNAIRSLVNAWAAACLCILGIAPSAALADQDQPPPFLEHANTLFRREAVGRHSLWVSKPMPVERANKVWSDVRKNAPATVTVLRFDGDVPETADQISQLRGSRSNNPLSLATAIARRESTLEQRAMEFAKLLTEAKQSELARHALTLTPARVRSEIGRIRLPKVRTQTQQAVVERKRRADVAKEYEVLGSTPPDKAVVVVSDAPLTVLFKLYADHDGARAEPAVAAAIVGSWRNRFGAHLRTLGKDGLEVVVARPPQNKHEARQLAFELFLIGPVDESGLNLSRPSAKQLMREATSRVWRCFWFTV